MARDQRRLAAIVCADAAGFSRLMSVDEGGTLAALKSHLHALFEPKISEHGGRVVKRTGDGLLVEFASVVDAVRCAVDVQRGMAERNRGIDPNKRIDFRIGINVGDIIIDADDIFGDGVNVAARLQTLAEPGEICVSKSVRDQVVDKLNFSFEELGARKVKNIARPVEAYRVNVVHDPRSANYRRRPRLNFRGWQPFATAILIVTVLGAASWAVSRFMTTASALQSPAFSLAVVPFTVSPASAAGRQFADGVVHGIASAMGRTTRYAKVVVTTPSTESTKRIDPLSIGRERNVRYVLEGDIGIANDNAKVAVRLLLAQTSTQLWTGEVEAPVGKWTSESAEAALAFTRGLREAMWDAEIDRVSHQASKESSPPVDLVLRASMLMSPPKRLAQGARTRRRSASPRSQSGHCAAHAVMDQHKELGERSER